MDIVLRAFEQTERLASRAIDATLRNSMALATRVAGRGKHRAWRREGDARQSRAAARK